MARAVRALHRRSVRACQGVFLQRLAFVGIVDNSASDSNGRNEFHCPSRHVRKWSEGRSRLRSLRLPLTYLQPHPLRLSDHVLQRPIAMMGDNDHASIDQRHRRVRREGRCLWCSSEWFVLMGFLGPLQATKASVVPKLVFIRFHDESML